MDQNKFAYFVSRYKTLDSDELVELYGRKGELADEAVLALDAVFSERGINVEILSRFSEAQSEPAAHDPTDQSATTVKQVRPWVRFWARGFDMFIFYSTFSIVCLVIGVRIQIPTSYVIGMILSAMWVAVEPFFLSQLGATPGKLLLQTRVTHQDGTLLSYGEAFKRSVRVWIFGEALYIPVVHLIALANAYGKLSRTGITAWDKNGRFLVRHSPIGAARVIVIVTIVLAMVTIYRMAMAY